MGNIHLLSPRAHGLVRNRLPGKPRRPRLRRRDSSTHLFLGHCSSSFGLPLLPALPLTRLCCPQTGSSGASSAGKLDVAAYSAGYYLEFLACV